MTINDIIMITIMANFGFFIYRVLRVNCKMEELLHS